MRGSFRPIAPGNGRRPVAANPARRRPISVGGRRCPDAGGHPCRAPPRRARPLTRPAPGHPFPSQAVSTSPAPPRPAPHPGAPSVWPSPTSDGHSSATSRCRPPLRPDAPPPSSCPMAPAGITLPTRVLHPRSPGSASRRLGSPCAEWARAPTAVASSPPTPAGGMSASALADPGAMWRRCSTGPLPDGASWARGQGRSARATAVRRSYRHRDDALPLSRRRRGRCSPPPGSVSDSSLDRVDRDGRAWLVACFTRQMIARRCQMDHGTHRGSRRTRLVARHRTATLPRACPDAGRRPARSG
jgi:hypothetical protein